ncbi:MAG: hypothetical protein NVSMB66_4400 [Candidatus Doudnabacteria bacterium]
MVAEYYGIIRSEKELAELTKCTREKGSSAANIVIAAKKIGLEAAYKDNGTLDEIKQYLSKNIPVIVDWFSINDGHYSVVVKIDKKFIYLQDPELAKINKIDLTTFKRIWFDFKGDFLKNPEDLFIRRMIIIQKKLN